MGILLLIGLVDFVARCAIMFAAGAGDAIGAGRGMGGRGPVMAALIGIPVSMVIHAGMLSSLLPTTLGRACLVVAFQLLIVVPVVITLAALMVGVTAPQ
ncbi:hypothetical protein FTUN_4402 [Frigoriglobus tundricola]|uniref:Uncharacterized protein n=2 Tax=Frigoriglobus tundricola TaxID=2774151 RepID=A0A6M5YVA0_9BACT|nr:hypothetical protein FTUN_4402 [Frigoriglobus tundricola]